jgi:hypothetical protein
MDDMCLDAPLGQPACQPKSITPGLEGDGDARDGATVADCLIASAVQQAQESPFVRRDLLQGCRSIPGTVAAINQFDWLSSMTATRVESCAKGTRDLLKSFGWGIRHSFGV